MKLYANITKVDEAQHMVWGYASTSALDSQGEIVTTGALAKALGDYRTFSNIREMHRPVAVGVAKDASVDDKGLYVSAKIIDPLAWEKVVEGVYKGFSIGGTVTGRDADQPNIITGMNLSEISLVDRPANPEAVFDLFKVAGDDAADGDADADADADDDVTDDAADPSSENGDGTAEDGGAGSLDWQARLQRIHDDVVALGAMCPEAVVAKRGAPHAKLTALNQKLDRLSKRLAELEAAPKPAKGVLRAMDKAADAGKATSATLTDDPTAAIKKAWETPIRLMG